MSVEWSKILITALNGRFLEGQYVRESVRYNLNVQKYKYNFHYHLDEN